jgi:hypothetical protein
MIVRTCISVAVSFIARPRASCIQFLETMYKLLREKTCGCVASFGNIGSHEYEGGNCKRATTI